MSPVVAVLVMWLFAAFVFTCAAIRAVGRLIRRAATYRAPQAWPRLAILRPCEGLDVELETNLLSSVTCPYDGEREVWILVPTASDPAYAIAERVRREAARRAPSIRVEILLTAIETVANRKVAQLSRALAEIDRQALVVVADSDIQLGEGSLDTLVAALLSDPRAGAASAPPIERKPRTLADRASAALLASTAHSLFCLAGLAERAKGAPVMCGALMICRRAQLEEVGGFAGLERFLGEDFELARRLHERGYTAPVVALPSHAADHGRSFAAVVRRYSRWSTVTRQQRPALFPSYFLLIGCTPLVMCGTVGAMAMNLSGHSLLLLGLFVLVAARVALAHRLHRAFELPTGLPTLVVELLLGEALILVSALLAAGPPEVEWRGRRYRIARGGAMLPL